jgi:hypothetical protein
LLYLTILRHEGRIARCLGLLFYYTLFQRLFDLGLSSRKCLDEAVSDRLLSPCEANHDGIIFTSKSNRNYKSFKSNLSLTTFISCCPSILQPDSALPGEKTISVYPSLLQTCMIFEDSQICVTKTINDKRTNGIEAVNIFAASRAGHIQISYTLTRCAQHTRL